MAFNNYVTSSLIQQVRDIIDEDNNSAVTDDTILASLNRAQARVATILARRYNPPMLTTREVPVSGATYDIPENTLEERLLGVDWKPSGSAINYSKLRAIAHNDVHAYESPAAGQGIYPIYYYITGSQFNLLPGTPPGGTLRLWLLEEPRDLVLEQGRITHVSVAGNYVIVDDVGEQVSTATDELESYVNIVDKDSGKVKATLQVQSLAQDGKVTFRTVPTRTQVANQDVGGTVPISVQQDDYICSALGTCIPLLKKPSSNFVIQYAAAEMVKRLSGDTGLELSVLSKLEEDVERSWSGRPNTLRIRDRSGSWQVPYLSRRYR